MKRDNKTQAQLDCDKVKTQFEDILAILPDLASKIDKKKLLDLIVQRTKQLLEADKIHLRVFDPIDDVLILEADSEKEIESKYPKLKSIEANKGIVGEVFITRQPWRRPNVQTETPFTNFRDKFDPVSEAKYIHFLELFGPLVAVPLLVSGKVIGVLLAIRTKEKPMDDLPLPFDEGDEEVLKHFANESAIVLRLIWFFNAATWQPKGALDFSIKKLCDEVVVEASKMTGAIDARVRFVDWKGERLVPGTINWPYDTSGEPQHPEVCVRNKNKDTGCLVGWTAEEKTTKFSNNLQEKNVFTNFVKYMENQKVLSSGQLEALKKWQEAVSNTDVSKIKDFLKKEHLELNKSQIDQKIKEKIEKRLETFINLIDITKPEEIEPKISECFQNQIKAVEELYNAQNKYLNNYLANLHSEVAVPILIGNKLLGVLNVHSDKKGWFAESDHATLEVLAGRVATAVMEHQQRVLTRIQEIGREMTSSNDFEEMAESVANGIKEVAFLVGGENIYPLLYPIKTPESPKKLKDDQENFKEKFDRQIRKSVLSKINNKIELSPYEKKELDLLNVPIRNNGLGWKAIEKELQKLKEKESAQKSKESKKSEELVFIVRENVDDPVIDGSASAQKHGVMSTACLPLVFGNIVYGLLYIHITERHFFTELEKEVLTLFAGQAAIVSKNLKRRYKEPTYDSRFSDKLIKDCINIGEEMATESSK